MAGVWHFPRAAHLRKSQLDGEALSLSPPQLGWPTASWSPAEGGRLGEVLWALLDSSALMKIFSNTISTAWRNDLGWPSTTILGLSVYWHEGWHQLLNGGGGGCQMQLASLGSQEEDMAGTEAQMDRLQDSLQTRMFLMKNGPHELSREAYES